MTVRVTIPSRLSHLTGGIDTFDVNASTVREVIAKISETHPRFGQEILDPNGRILGYISVFADDRAVDATEMLNDGCHVEFYLPSAGG